MCVQKLFICNNQPKYLTVWDIGLTLLGCQTIQSIIHTNQLSEMQQSKPTQKPDLTSEELKGLASTQSRGIEIADDGRDGRDESAARLLLDIGQRTSQEAQKAQLATTQMLD